MGFHHDPRANVIIYRGRTFIIEDGWAEVLPGQYLRSDDGAMVYQSPLKENLWAAYRDGYLMRDRQGEEILGESFEEVKELIKQAE